MPPNKSLFVGLAAQIDSGVFQLIPPLIDSSGQDGHLLERACCSFDLFCYFLLSLSIYLSLVDGTEQSIHAMWFSVTWSVVRRVKRTCCRSTCPAAVQYYYWHESGHRLRSNLIHFVKPHQAQRQRQN
jgi:hypothetical protein